MERRIFGLENEYGVTCTLRGQRRLSPDEVARYLFRRVVSWGRSSNVFLENGARLYLDVGSHPEYATPECDSIADLVVHDKAGERILEGLVHSAEQRLRQFQLCKTHYKLLPNKRKHCDRHTATALKRTIRHASWPCSRQQPTAGRPGARESIAVANRYLGGD